MAISLLKSKCKRLSFACRKLTATRINYQTSNKIVSPRGWLFFERIKNLRQAFGALTAVGENMIEHYYIEEGKGEPLILLHGNGENSGYFHFQIKEFAEYFHVIAIDTRGHGKTKRGEKPFTLSQFADDLADFMNKKQIERASILGFSDGGNIAMLFAIKYPQMVDKLVLNGANFHPSGIKKHFQLLVELRYRLTLINKTPSEKIKRKKELLSLMVNEPDISKDELKSIKAKTLVVAGTRDLIKESHTRELAKLIPNSRLCFIKGNHAVARMNPKMFNKTVLDFLLENSKK